MTENKKSDEHHTSHHSLTMYCLWWLLVFVNLSRASWVDDFINGKSVEVGNDVSVSFKELPNADNASYLSSHALRIDLLGIGISFSKAPGTDAFNVGFYLDDDRNEQGNSCHILTTHNLLLVTIHLLSRL